MTEFEFEHDFESWPNLSHKQMQSYYFQSPVYQITESFRGKVTKVSDADTIKVNHTQREDEVTVRLAFMDAPEKNTKRGQEATDWLARRILGDEVDVMIDKSNRLGKWNRIIGEVMHRGVNLNEEIKMKTKLKDEFREDLEDVIASSI